MRILHIIPSLAKGGAERLVLDICTQLHTINNVEVMLVTFRPNNDYIFMSEKINHQVIPSSVQLSVSGKNTLHVDELERLINKFQPHIIHSHLFEAEVVSRAKLYKPARYFTHCHDHMHQFKKMSARDMLNKTRLTEWYERNWILKKYRECNNHFIFISRFIEAYFKESLPADVVQHQSLLHNCIDLKKFAHTGQRSVNAGHIRLINCGSFTPRKNQAFLVDVMEQLLASNNHITLDLIGDGPMLEEVKQKVAQRHLSQHIFFRGKINDVQAYYKQSDIYVHSASVESFGLVLLEAMAAGLPVIALDGQGNRDLIEDGKMGYILQEEDPVAFARVIIQLINHPEQYSFISNYVKEFVKKFDVVDYVDRLLDLYESTLVSNT
jgi:glycosyltransferase involved in cell wall biosynthesis